VNIQKHISPTKAYVAEKSNKINLLAQ